MVMLEKMLLISLKTQKARELAVLFFFFTFRFRQNHKLITYTSHQASLERAITKY